MAFLTFEGIEGSGKSTQARRFAAELGEQALLTAEPGATRLGRSIRGLLLEQRGEDVSPLAELLLFFADRAQHVHEVIRPCLEAGQIVVCDRFTDSTTAYQGYGRGLPLELIRTLAREATGGLTPDLTVLLDVSVEIGLTRARRRGRPDRMELEERAFHERVAAGYRALAAQEPNRFIVVDAVPGEEEVARAVRAALAGRGIEARLAAR